MTDSYTDELFDVYNCMSIMIEINRFLYMDEKTGMKKDSFNKVKGDISETIQIFASN